MKSKPYDSFNEKDIRAFEPEAKIGLLGTVTPEGLPHLTLITSMQALTTKKMVWGQFSKGVSKEYVKNNPKTGFLILTPDKKLWRGKADWTNCSRQGEEYEMYNMKPMFRYNAYLGIHTVHYMDLVETYGCETLPVAGVAVASVMTWLVKRLVKDASGERILKTWAQNLFNRFGALKFIGYIGADGYPRIIPLLQCQAAGGGTLAFSGPAYSDELKGLQPGACAAVFGLTMKMEDVLVRGRFRGLKRNAGVNIGVLDIDYVYNSMPPKQGVIYPEPELAPVVDF